MASLSRHAIVGLDVRTTFALSKVIALSDPVAAEMLRNDALAAATLVGLHGCPYLDACPAMFADEPDLASAYTRGMQTRAEEGDEEDRRERALVDAIAVEATYAAVDREMMADIVDECRQLGLTRSN